MKARLRLVLTVLVGSLTLTIAGCGGSSRLEGQYTCINGDSWRFSPDGIVTYQGALGGGREMPYVVEDTAVKVLRREGRDSVGDNVYREFERDGDRLVNVRKGERNDNYFCTVGKEKPDPVAVVALTPKPEPTWKPNERANAEIVEVVGLRLNDSLDDVRRKLTTSANPFQEIRQSIISENPEVFELLQFSRTNSVDGTSDGIVAYFSAPPQRLIGLERQWSNYKNPFPWQKMLAPAVQRYGQPIVTGNGPNAAETWFVSPSGRPLEPPPTVFANECPTGVTAAINPRPSTLNCGRILLYKGGERRTTQPVSNFQVALLDTEQLSATHRAWAQAAENAEAAAAKAKLDAAAAPDQ